MRKDTILGSATLLLIFCVIFFYATTTSSVKAPGNVDVPPLEASKHVEHAQYYDIVTNYASSTPLTGNKNTEAVALMKKFVGDTIVQFKLDGNFAHLTPKDIQMMGFDTGRKETLQITYLIASSPKTVSYIFTIVEDTLGAHPNTFFHTFTFNTVTGEPLSLSDLFMSGSYLNTLSSLSRAKLPGIIGPEDYADFIKRGTTPEDKNFENFFFDNQDFVVLFPPYQVAPYSAGPQTLRIPRSELRDVLKLDYR